MPAAHSKISTLQFVGLVTAFALALWGCGSHSGSETEELAISMIASPDSVEEDGTVVVEAFVTDRGTAMAGRSVSFTYSGDGEGYFTPAVDTTDADGVAASVFTATGAGSVTLIASISGTSLKSTTDLSIQQAGTELDGSIDMSASPGLLLANGTDTSRVTITVRDADGQPAPDQTIVKLAAGEKFIDLDGNGYWSGGVDSLVYDANSNGAWDAWGLIPSSVTINGGNGQATVNYVSGNDAVTVYVKATVNSGAIVASRDIQLQLTANSSINSIYLGSSLLQLSVKGTGGRETTEIRAAVYDENGNPVSEGRGINFIILDGPGGGEHFGAVESGPYPAITNSQGVATAPLNSGTVSGTVRIRAYADTILSNATQVLISAGPPAQIVVDVHECNVPYFDEAARTVDVVAVVSDVYLNPVNDSTVVYFSTDEGTMKSHEQPTMDLEGIARSKWISGTNVPTADGIVWVWAETAGGTVIDSTYFYNTWNPVDLQLTGMPVSIDADGVSEVTVKVDGFDVNGNPVVGGTVFEADASYVSIEGGVLENGCGSATDRVKLTSTTLTADQSLTGNDDDGIGAVDNVQFWSGGTAFASVNLQLLTGQAFSKNCELTTPASVAAGETIAISAIIRDGWGNPLGDHTLVLTASGGSVTGGTQESNAYGEASGFQWTAPATAGTYSITITDTDPRGGITLVRSFEIQ